MLSRDEAYAKAEHSNIQTIEGELEIIEGKIIDACAMGKFSISMSGGLNINTVKELQRLGYEVEKGSRYNETTFNISWR